MPRRPHRLALALLAGCLAACSSSLTSANGAEGDAPGARMCTEIGCVNGLAVRLPRVPTGTWRVEVTDLATGATRAVDCTPATCGATIFLADFQPGHVRVRVTTAGGTRETDVRPAYRTSQPNGPDCPPTCVQADVEMTLPG